MVNVVVNLRNAIAVRRLAPTVIKLLHIAVDNELMEVNRFIDGCLNFYKIRKHLTEKQVRPILSDMHNKRIIFDLVMTETAISFSFDEEFISENNLI